MDYEDVREKIKNDFRNEDLRGVALSLADIIEYASNSTSDIHLKKGIYSFDKGELEQMLERSKMNLKAITVVGD